MEYDKDRYALCLIVQPSDTLAKWRNIATTVRSYIKSSTIPVTYRSGGTYKNPIISEYYLDVCVLNRDTNIQITVFICLPLDDLASVRNGINAFSVIGNAYFLPLIRYFYLKGTFPLEEIKSKVLAITGNVFEKVLFLDSTSNVSSLLGSF